MALVALTNIVHGMPDGERIVIPAGDEIGNALPKDVVASLREAGAIGQPVQSNQEVNAERDALQARVAELEKMLAEAEAAKADPGKDKPPAGGK